MPTLVVRPIQEHEIEHVVELWRACGLTRPHNDPYQDIALVRSNPNSEVFIGLDAEARIVASVLVGHDGHRGAAYYVSSNPSMRKCGFGRQIMAAAEDWLKAKGIWKINLMVRTSNKTVQPFYEAVGFAKEEMTIMSKWLDPSMKPKPNT